MSEKPISEEAKPEANDSHADVTTLNGSWAGSVLENINWRRYADMSSGQPSLVVGFGVVERERDVREHPDIYMNMRRPMGDVWPEDLEDVTFQYSQGHLINYYRLNVGRDGITVSESSPDRSTVERIVPEDRGRMLEFETVDVPVNRVKLSGLSAAMNRLEANSELSKRETQTFVLEGVGLSDTMIHEMLGVAPDTVKEYRYRINDKIARYRTTLNWLEDMQSPEANYV